jgi:hypothetical protein
MKYSIFHTSHCGSTLLACLLSKSIPTLTEPDWVHEIIKIGSAEGRRKFALEHAPDNILVKYSSLVNDVAPFVGGKTVLLYRDLDNHLRHFSKYPNVDLKFEAISWVNKMASAIMSDDIFLIETNVFLKDPENSAKEICKFFKIEYKPLGFEIDFNVKEAGYNRNNIPIVVERKEKDE